MKFGSLFTGVGGLDLGLEAAQWECKWQVELNKWCYETLKHNWPTVPKWRDVRDVNGANLEPVDVIAFGSPCQDLSRAGRIDGLQGSKSSLFFEAIRIIKEMQHATKGKFPRWAIWENVPGAFSSNGGADFGTVLDCMAEMGALGIEWACLDAQYFGVPQHRERLFVVSCFDPSVHPRNGRQVLNVQHVGRRYIAKNRNIDETPAGSTPICFGGTVTTVWKERTVSNTICATERKNPGNVIVQNNKIRRLSPIECERLMGWPDDHTLYRSNGKPNSNSARYEMCGNGVASPVAQWVATQISLAEYGL